MGTSHVRGAMKSNRLMSFGRTTIADGNQSKPIANPALRSVGKNGGKPIVKNTTDTCANTETSENKKGVQLPVALEIWDYFAAAALPAVMREDFGNALKPSEVASDCALYADAMLAERAKRGGS